MEVLMHPFEMLKTQNPAGLDQFIDKIKQRIAEIDAYIPKFAEEDGQPELADKDTLYELFKRGVQENLVYGLRDVFVHYYCIFKSQLLHEMLNEHQFDQRDVEILQYFHDKYKFPKDCTHHIRLECPDMLVFETTFSLIIGAKVARYMSLFYKAMGYAYDALMMAYGSSTELWNPSISIDSLFEFDVKESVFIRTVRLREIVCNDEKFWVRNNSERKLENVRVTRALNKEQYNAKSHEYKNRYCKRNKERGLVRLKIDGSYKWFDKSDTILIKLDTERNKLRYLLRSNATPEQIATYEAHKDEWDSALQDRYKNVGMRHNKKN